MSAASSALPARTRPNLALMPASFFSMAVGALAWGHAWRAATEVWRLPLWLAHAAAAVGLLIWLALLLAYAAKWRAHPQAVQQELAHPVQSAMAALAPVTVLLAAITLKPLWLGLAWVLLVLGLAAQLALGLWVVGRFWQGGRAPDSLNTSVYLPAVAQNLVAATAAASFGLTALGGLFFGAGILSWLALESMVLSRASMQAAIPVPQRPLFGIQVAPALVAGVSYMSLTSGPPDLLAHMLLGYGLYQALLALRLWPWIREAAFAPSYWAFSFGIMAMATMALRLLERAPSEWLWQLLAPVLFGVANAVMALLLWHTWALARQGNLWPAAVGVSAPPPAPPSAGPQAE
jgi:tellurite resistance protein